MAKFKFYDCEYCGVNYNAEIDHKCCPATQKKYALELRTELTQAQEEVQTIRTIGIGWENANQTLRERAEKAEAKVRELEEAIEMSLPDAVNCRLCTDNNLQLRLKAEAECESKDKLIASYREALERAACDAKLLYTMLDDIDTCGDLYKPEITPYYK